MHNQKGSTLVEFMIASCLGLIAFAIVGALYTSGQKAAMERAKELMLLQNTASVLQMMKSDIRRAGFDGKDTKSVKISGASNTLYTTSSIDSALIAYVYNVGGSGKAPMYKNVVYEQRLDMPELLFVCEKKQTRIWDIGDVISLAGTGTCNSLFDNNKIHLSRFEIISNAIESTGAKSALVTVTLEAKLKDAPGIRTQQSFTVKQRNWQ